jgi:hypothetical protein
MKALRRKRSKVKKFTLLSARKSLPPKRQFPPHAGAKGVCEAFPREPLGVPPYTGVAGNTVLLKVYVADLTPGTTCRFNETNPGLIICTGSQISPFLVLTASHCLAGDQVAAVPGCENSELVDILGESSVRIGLN